MKKKKGAAFPFVLCAVILIAAAFLYVYAYILPEISGALAKTEIVRYASMETWDDINCLFIRSEETVFASSSGNISYYAGESEKTRKGAKVLDIYPEGGSAKGYYCSRTGFVSYYIDGYENVLYPEMIHELTLSQFNSFDISPENTRREYAKASEPLYKLVESDTWYIIFPVAKGRLKDYKEGSKVSIVFDDGSVKGTVDDIIGTEDTKLISLSCRQYYPKSATLRSSRAKVITSSFEGLSVPNSAVTEKDSMKGVYVKDISGDFVFTPVYVLCSDDERTLLKADSFTMGEGDSAKKYKTVRQYDEILTNAS